MRRLAIFSILLLITWGCASFPKKEHSENFMLKRGTNLLARGSRHLEKGCFKEAAENFTLAYQDFQATDDLPGMAKALNNLAISLLEAEEPEKAERFASRALAINRSLNDFQGQAANLSILGQVHLERGEDENARCLWQEALGKAKKGSAKLRASILNDLSVAFIHEGKIEKARKYLIQALALNPDSAAVHQNLGKAAELSGHLVMAERSYLKALSLDRKKGYSPGIAADLTVLGNLYLKMDKKPEAAETLARALGLRTLLDQKDKADAIREDLKHAGFDVAPPLQQLNGEEIAPACR